MKNLLRVRGKSAAISISVRLLPFIAVSPSWATVCVVTHLLFCEDRLHAFNLLIPFLQNVLRPVWILPVYTGTCICILKALRYKLTWGIGGALAAVYPSYLFCMLIVVMAGAIRAHFLSGQ